MKNGLADDLWFVFSRRVLRRDALTALVAGSLLSLANQLMSSCVRRLPRLWQSSSSSIS